MIPKIIHYCWFGRKPLPQLAIKCIDSWKKYLPDYEIKEWNEDNFDLDYYPYVREAYDSRKFAFVTDVVRLYALYHEGGIYMDTDVEVLKSLNPFLHHHAFIGFENYTNIQTGIMASEVGGKWAKDNLDYYIGKHFLKEDGTMDLTTNVSIITNNMLPLGLRQDNTYQDFPNLITFYPKDYFCPKDYSTKNVILTPNTVTIHHFDGSWLSKRYKFKKRISLLIGKRITKTIIKLKHIFR